MGVSNSKISSSSSKSLSAKEVFIDRICGKSVANSLPPKDLILYVAVRDFILHKHKPTQNEVYAKFWKLAAKDKDVIDKKLEKLNKNLMKSRIKTDKQKMKKSLDMMYKVFGEFKTIEAAAALYLFKKVAHLPDHSTLLLPTQVNQILDENRQILSQAESQQNVHELTEIILKKFDQIRTLPEVNKYLFGDVLGVFVSLSPQRQHKSEARLRFENEIIFDQSLLDKAKLILWQRCIQRFFNGMYAIANQVKKQQQQKPQQQQLQQQQVQQQQVQQQQQQKQQQQKQKQQQQKQQQQKLPPQRPLPPIPESSSSHISSAKQVFIDRIKQKSLSDSLPPNELIVYAVVRDFLLQNHYLAQNDGFEKFWKLGANDKDEIDRKLREIQSGILSETQSSSDEEKLKIILEITPKFHCQFGNLDAAKSLYLFCKAATLPDHKNGILLPALVKEILDENKQNLSSVEDLNDEPVYANMPTRSEELTEKILKKIDEIKTFPNVSKYLFGDIFGIFVALSQQSPDKSDARLRFENEIIFDQSMLDSEKKVLWKTCIQRLFKGLSILSSEMEEIEKNKTAKK